MARSMTLSHIVGKRVEDSAEAPELLMSVTKKRTIPSRSLYAVVNPFNGGSNGQSP